MKFNVVKFCTNLTKFFYKLRTSAKGEGGRGMSNADKCGQGGPKNGHFVRTSFMDDPKVEFPPPYPVVHVELALYDPSRTWYMLNLHCMIPHARGTC